MALSKSPRLTGTGPFRADQIPEGSPYELKNGHPILCMGSGDRHGSGNADGVKVLGTDPAVVRAGVDVGFSFGEGESLRAPDISVGNLKGVPGWAQAAPPLAVEYADRGQDEGELQDKIAELLREGTRFVWVVRLSGPLRVEVYEPGKPVRLVNADEELTAPDILQNPVPVRALVDPEASNEATLRNLLNRKGYRSLEDVEAKGQLKEAHAALLDLCEVLGIELPAERRAEIERADLATLQSLRAGIKQHRRWPV